MLNVNKNNEVGPLRILVVDDNVDAAVVTGSLLDHLGYSVSIEHTPKDALERVEAGVFDLCVLDIGLPDMDGYELAALLREKPNTSNAVFAALTGYGSQYYVNKSASEGFKYHFVKPVPLHKLIGACELIVADLAGGGLAKK